MAGIPYGSAYRVHFQTLLIGVLLISHEARIWLSTIVHQHAMSSAVSSLAVLVPDEGSLRSFHTSSMLLSLCFIDRIVKVTELNHSRHPSAICGLFLSIAVHKSEYLSAVSG